MRATITSLFFSLMLSACINTNVKSYLDADYGGLQLRRVVLDLHQVAPTMKHAIENNLVAHLKEAGVIAIPIEQLVPPTRDYSAEQVRELVNSGGNDAILAMQVTDTSQNVVITSSYTYMSGSAYTSGNRTKFNSGGFSAPIGTAESSAAFKVTLFDPKNGRRMWVADVFTLAEGTAFVGDTKGMAESAAEGVVKQLQADGRLKK